MMWMIFVAVYLVGVGLTHLSLSLSRSKYWKLPDDDSLEKKAVQQVISWAWPVGVPYKAFTSFLEYIADRIIAHRDRVRQALEELAGEPVSEDLRTADQYVPDNAGGFYEDSYMQQAYPQRYTNTSNAAKIEMYNQMLRQLESLPSLPKKKKKPVKYRPDDVPF